MQVLVTFYISVMPEMIFPTYLWRIFYEQDSHGTRQNDWQGELGTRI